MKRLSPILLAAIVLQGCGDSAEAGQARREINEALKAADTYTRKEIEDMTNKLRNQWTDLEVELAKLKAEAEAGGERVKADLSKVIAEVEAKAAQAAERLDSASDAGAAEAGESLTHLQEAFNSAKTAVQEAWRELRK